MMNIRRINLKFKRKAPPLFCLDYRCYLGPQNLEKGGQILINYKIMRAVIVSLNQPPFCDTLKALSDEE